MPIGLHALVTPGLDPGVYLLTKSDGWPGVGAFTPVFAG